MQPTKEELLIQSQYRLIERLLESEERWRFALEGSGDGVWDWNIATGDCTFSKYWESMLGYEEHEFSDLELDWKDLVHPEDKEMVDSSLESYLQGQEGHYVNEYRMQRRSGDWIWVLARGMAVRRDSEGKPLRIIGTHTDISKRKKAEETVRRQAYFDDLTALPNRALFRDRLEQEMRRVHRSGEKLALLFIDLDDFKLVNDTLGHDIGDRLLAEAAQRISDCVREADTVARFAGDEFTVIVSDISHIDDSERVATSILSKLSSPYIFDGEHVHISASIGITIYPSDAESIEDLCRNADQAMYEAKKAGRKRFRYFTPAMQQAAQERHCLIHELYQAIENQQFEVFYQPIMNLATGDIRKVEALVRWNHPERGMISPMAFIPVAEESGQIIEIGDQVFRQVVEDLKRWRNEFDAKFKVSVNLSPLQIRNNGGCFEAWLSEIQQMDLPGSSLIFEVTEGVLLDAEEHVLDKLRKINEAGILIALDDFGTGYSSLSYLKHFKFDFLKIDRAFIGNLENDPYDKAITEAVIVMAHKLGIKVVAEGVETDIQQALLKKAGCDFAQGYLYAYPLPAHEFETLWNQRMVSQGSLPG